MLRSLLAGWAVIQSIVDAKLPVSVSSEADFSTVVLPDGTIKPRE